LHALGFPVGPGEHRYVGFAERIVAYACLPAPAQVNKARYFSGNRFGNTVVDNTFLNEAVRIRLFGINKPEMERGFSDIINNQWCMNSSVARDRWFKRNIPVQERIGPV
jgi:hypothetical protein